MRWKHLKSAVIAPVLLAYGCGGSVGEAVPGLGNCMTEEGWAQWTEPCFFGQADGHGVATYQDGHIETIKGRLERGVPKGAVEISYRDGARYSGSLKDGEFHGFGKLVESWGEAYSGNWREGFRHGIGHYTGQDGKSVEGLWDRGRLLGSWFSATNNGCKVWWAATGGDPVGSLEWDGACVNGRAEGAGKIDWTDETPGAASGSTIQFRGELSAGKLNGEGVWTQTDRYTNVIHRTVKTGAWMDGARDGYGKEVKESHFLDGSFKAATTTYAGSSKNGQFSGEGERLKSKTYNDGGLEWEKERGYFVEDTLRQGVITRHRSVLPDENANEMFIGRFESRQFLGFGTAVTRRRAGANYYHSIVKYDGPVADGGEGVIRYADGDSFTGRMGAGLGWHGSPLMGHCILPSVKFIGQCQSSQLRLSDYERRTCLSPVNKESDCLKEIARFIY